MKIQKSKILASSLLMSDRIKKVVHVMMKWCPKTIYSVTLCKERLCKRRIKLWPFWCVKENKRWYFISVGFPWVAFLIMIPNTIFSRYEPISRLISVTLHSELLLLKKINWHKYSFFQSTKRLWGFLLYFLSKWLFIFLRYHHGKNICIV